jgi:hypothetical protein
MKSDLDKITEIEDVNEAYNKFEEVMVGELVNITSFKVGSAIFVKHVDLLTRFVRSKISQTLTDSVNKDGGRCKQVDRRVRFFSLKNHIV